LLGWMGIHPELTWATSTTEVAVVARTVVQSSLLFSRSNSSRHVLVTSSDADPQKRIRISGASDHANGTRTLSQQGFQSFISGLFLGITREFIRIETGDKRFCPYARAPTVHAESHDWKGFEPPLGQTR